MATEPPRSHLPAPYRNPWGVLAGDLRAVAADSILRARELVRRNGEGSLWRPSWWPAGVAPLFWPLLCGLILALLLLLGRAVTTWMPSPPPPAAQAEGGAPRIDERVPLIDEPAPLIEHSPPLTDVSAAPPQSTDQSEPAVAELAPPEPALTPELPLDAAAEPALLQPQDALAGLLQQPENRALLVGAMAQLEIGTLVLEVSSAFTALPGNQRQQQVEQWLQQAQALGFDHLEVRDPRAGLLARDALVGSGMIVLERRLQSPSLQSRS